MNPPLRVLFLCSGNSARSQMAEAILRHLSKGRAVVFSAGSAPKDDVHPTGRRILQDRFGIDTSSLRPKHVDQLAGQAFDYVITLCAEAAEACPVFPGTPNQFHWSFEDPAQVVGEQEQRRAFEAVANEPTARLRVWMALPAVSRALGTRAEP